MFNKILFQLLFSVLLAFNCFAAKVEEIKINSVYLGKESPLTIVIPDAYSVSDSLPVIFLLHGYSGDNNNYVKNIKELLSTVDALKIIVVCVNGENAWYMDSPVKKESRYESYIIKELIPFISDKYKVYRSGNKRGIAGLSMGGFGAVSLGFKNPSYFGYVGSTSGGMDILPFPGNWELNKVLGDQKDNMQQWKTYSPLYFIDNIDMKKIKFKLVLDCGKGDFFFEANNQFDTKLTKSGFAHEYLIAEGVHNWEYWNKTIPVHLNKFCEAVR